MYIIVPKSILMYLYVPFWRSARNMYILVHFGTFIMYAMVHLALGFFCTFAIHHETELCNLVLTWTLSPGDSEGSSGEGCPSTKSAETDEALVEILMSWSSFENQQGDMLQSTFLFKKTNHIITLTLLQNQIVQNAQRFLSHQTTWLIFLSARSTQFRNTSSLLSSHFPYFWGSLVPCNWVM
jgi:hypothetical protein